MVSLRVDDRSEETLDGRRNSRSDESWQCGRSADRTKLEPFLGDVIAGSGDQSRAVQTPEKERWDKGQWFSFSEKGRSDKTADGLVVRPRGLHCWQQDM